MSLATILASLALIIFCTKIVINWFKNRHFWSCVNKIPGPPTLPLIGNAHQLSGLSPEKLYLSHRSITELNPGPIFKIKIFNKVFVNMYGPEDIEQLFSNMAHISKSEMVDLVRPWLREGLMTSQGTKWQTRRKILNPVFHYKVLQDFLQVFNDETGKLVEDLKVAASKDQLVNVAEPLNQFTLGSNARTVMGISLKVSKVDYYKNAIYRMGQLVISRIYKPWLHKDSIYNWTSQGRESQQLVKTLHDVSTTVIEERKKSPSEGKQLALLDLLLRHQAINQDIDDDGIREEVDTFMYAGHDTVATSLGFTLMLFANHPQIQEGLLREIEEVLYDHQEPTYQQLNDLKLMDRCIKESLRMYPSLPVLGRLTGEEIQTRSGYTIPNNCQVHVRVFELHHNESIYPEPRKFDPDRFLPENIMGRHPFAYIPFSAGPRNCIGQKFAILEMKVVLCGILRAFVLEAVDTPDTITFCADLVLRSKNGIKVKFVPRCN